MQLVEALCYRLEGAGGVFETFHWLYPPSCTVALGLTQLSTSNRNEYWISSLEGGRGGG
jgi:hypothetical protein